VQHPDETWMSVNDASEYLKVSRRGIDRLVKRGEVETRYNALDRRIILVNIDEIRRLTRTRKGQR
jgi:DNA-binding MarR family transcriptional regulator